MHKLQYYGENIYGRKVAAVAVSTLIKNKKKSNPLLVNDTRDDLLY